MSIPQNDGGNDSNSKAAPSGTLVFEKKMRFIVQSDGPSPMKPTTVGFDDDDDDEDEDEDINEPSKPNVTTRSMSKRRSDKEENDGDEEEAERKEPSNGDTAENKENGGQSAVEAPHIVNGRDLNAPLCSDDDDTDDGEDLDPSDKIICQFTKVIRKKNEWSVDLKHGLMHINGKDYAFQKAVNGHFTWK